MRIVTGKKRLVLALAAVAAVALPVARAAAATTEIVRSACSNWAQCTTLPLANFGTVSFSSAKATAAGYTGTIGDAAWSPTAIDLQAPAGGFFGRRFGAMATAAAATPGDLSTDGSSF